MLGLHENALLGALRSHRLIVSKVRTVESLPRTFGEKLIAQYQVDAPALYVVPGRIAVNDDVAVLEFIVAGVISNAAGHEQGRKGDGIDIGCDHLLQLATKAINRQTLGRASWSLTSAEMADDEVFEHSGLQAIEMKFTSSPIELEADYAEGEMAELADFNRFHGDIDSPADAGAVEYASWLQEPPDFSNSRPDAQMDVLLPGASA